MEFLAGIITTLFIEFLIYKVYLAKQRRMDLKVQATPRPGGARDYYDQEKK